MGSAGLGASLALVCIVGCGPVDGQIFDVLTSGASGSSTTNAETSPADAESSSGSEPGRCASAGPQFEGNDPRFVHDCGEPCDSDWCGCESCRAIAGSLGRLRGGSHRLSIEGGASGSCDYTVTVRLKSGEILAERSVTYNGLFTDHTDLIIPPGCSSIEFEWVQQTDVCSRIYGIVIEPN